MASVPSELAIFHVKNASRMEISTYFNRFVEGLEEAGDPKRAQGQQAYMKDHFLFYGLTSPELRQMGKAWMKEYGCFHGSQLRDFVQLCYSSPYRDLHYFAVEMVEKVQRKESADFIRLLEWMVAHNSWWDTVDWLAKLVGNHFLRFPEQRLTYTDKWINGEDMWLQRVAIIFQLRYKDRTDFVLLRDYVLKVADSKEFFLRKACGWALREYSKTDPDGVLAFVEAHSERLSGLTKREALRLLKG